MVMADGGHDGQDVEEIPQWKLGCKVSDEDLAKVGAAIRTVACTAECVLTGSAQPVVKVWRVAEGKVTESQRLRQGAVGSSCVEVSRDGRVAAVCSDDGAIDLWDFRDNKRSGTLASSIATAWKATFLPGDQGLVSGGPSGAICFWDLRRLAKERELGPDGDAQKPEDELPPTKRSKVEGGDRKDTNGRHPPLSPVFSLAVSADGRLLGVGRASGNISVLRLGGAIGPEWAGDVSAHQCGTPSVPVRALSFDASSKLLLSGGDDQHVCILDAAAWARRRGPSDTRWPQLERFSAHRGWVTSASACPDPRWSHVAVTTSWDFTVKLWDQRTQTLLNTFKDHDDCVFASAFAPGDSDFFATGGADARLAIYAAQEQAAAPKGGAQ